MMELREALRKSGARVGTLAFRVVIAVTLLTARPAASAGSDKTTYLIDDFDGPATLKTGSSPATPNRRQESESSHSARDITSKARCLLIAYPAVLATGAARMPRRFGRRRLRSPKRTIPRFPCGFVSLRRSRFLWWQRIPGAKPCGSRSAPPSSASTRAAGSTQMFGWQVTSQVLDSRGVWWKPESWFRPEAERRLRVRWLSTMSNCGIPRRRSRSALPPRPNHRRPTLWGSRPG